MNHAEKRLVIFDCDGVLVDSEPIALAVLADFLGQAGVAIDEEGVARRFLGRSLASVRETVRDEFGLEIDEAFLSRMRDVLYARFRAELRPIDGIPAVIAGFAAAGIDWCVASSSQKERVELCLRATGLIDHFAPHIFSATMVARGKPAPDLFLHAAQAMGYSPEQCLVIEDSPSGIEAARAAGMRVIAFTGGSHTRFADYRAALDQLSPDVRFDDMADLLQFVVPARRPKDNPDA
ncbi:MAG: HAD family hydrolase [Rhizobium sp.]|nr:HAD family hydrolase [Rhizobium sp.]